MNLKKLFLILVFTASISANAAGQRVEDIEIKFIRVVGDYSPNSTHDNTIEIHFTSPITWSSDSTCIDKNRVLIDAAHSHLVSAAYMAYASNMKININVNTVLPIRSGICEIAYLDLVK